MAVEIRGVPHAAVANRPVALRHRLYGFGSIYGKTLRDSRLGFLVVAGLLGILVFAGGGEMTSTYGTLDSRRELDVLSATLPPVMRGLYGNPVNVGTIGGFVTWHYGAYLTLLAGLWSILALSGTLAGEARRGSLDLVAAAPLPRAVVALEKVAGHATALVAAAAVIATAAWATGAVFATFPGDEIEPAAAAGFGAGIALKALMAGSVAFALAGYVGRGAAAGIAGALLFGGYVVTGYRAVVPAFDAVAGLSWLGWTADHVPLAGRSDWGSLGLVAVASALLLGIGVVAFVRRDIAITGTTRMPGPAAGAARHRRAGSPIVRRGPPRQRRMGRRPRALRASHGGRQPGLRRRAGEGTQPPRDDRHHAPGHGLVDARGVSRDALR